MFRWYVPFVRNGDGEETDDRRMKHIALAQPHLRNHMYVPPFLISIITPAHPPSPLSWLFLRRQNHEEKKLMPATSR